MSYILTKRDVKYLLMSAKEETLPEQPGWITASSGGHSNKPSSRTAISFCMFYKPSKITILVTSHIVD